METAPACRIVPLVPDRAEETAVLIRRTIESLDCYNDRAKKEEVSKYSAEQLLQLTDADADSVLIALADERVVGFCTSKYDDGLVWLFWYGVHSAYRERGIGQSLLEALARTLERRTAHKIWCDTRTDNVKSQRVLKRFGFTRIAHLRNHWYGHDYYLWEWTGEGRPAPEAE